MKDISKSALAFVWHMADAVLILPQTPRKVRKAVSAVGVVWSAFWFAKTLYDTIDHDRLVQINRQLANSTRIR